MLFEEISEFFWLEVFSSLVDDGAVLRSNWMYLPRVDCVPAVAMVGFVSTMMIGVRCRKLSAFREVKRVAKSWV